MLTSSSQRRRVLRPRRTNVGPARLEARLGGYLEGIVAANAAEMGVRQRPGGVGVRSEFFFLVAEELDHLVGLFGRDTGQTTLIAKPPTLRGFIAQTVLESSVHQIIPAYTVGAVIYGQSIVAGADLVFNSGGLVYPMEWFDLNVDARQLARVPT